MLTAGDWNHLGEVFDAGANAYRTYPHCEAHAAAHEAMASRCHLLANQAAAEADTDQELTLAAEYAPPGPAEFADANDLGCEHSAPHAAHAIFGGYACPGIPEPIEKRL
jgi:hypothetical protein